MISPHYERTARMTSAQAALKMQEISEAQIQLDLAREWVREHCAHDQLALFQAFPGTRYRSCMGCGAVVLTDTSNHNKEQS